MIKEEDLINLGRDVLEAVEYSDNETFKQLGGKFEGTIRVRVEYVSEYEDETNTNT